MDKENEKEIESVEPEKTQSEWEVPQWYQDTYGRFNQSYWD
jgi:hypothetical protein